jgi:hypothetical protein
MCLPLKDASETSRLADPVVQDNASTHDQSKSALRVRPVRDV